MGSAFEAARSSDETQVPISIYAAFAIGRFAVTFNEWDACVAEWRPFPLVPHASDRAGSRFAIRAILARHGIVGAAGMEYSAGGS